MSETVSDKQVHILFVDDDASLLAGIRRMLRPYTSSWSIGFCQIAADALAQVRRGGVDIVVSDVSMPDMDGLQFLTALKADAATRDVPVIMLTGLESMDLKRSALELGAADLLRKPVQREELYARVRGVLLLKEQQEQLEQANETLEARVAERTLQLEDSRLDLIWSLARAAEERDETTGQHIVRVAAYSRSIGQAMGLSKETIDHLTLASPLHDVGKIGVSDEVLLKPGRLTDADRLVMQEHSRIGEAILSPGAGSSALHALWRGAQAPGALLAAPSANPVLQMAARIARSHHERWDGAGYPDALAGQDIPLEARIVALADVYDALRSGRPYKRPYSTEKSEAIIRAEVGQHFDPEVHRAFEQTLPTLRQLSVHAEAEAA